MNKLEEENAAGFPRKRRSLPRGGGRLTDQTKQKDRKRGPVGITEQQRPQQKKSAEPTQHKQQQTNERLTLDGIYRMLAEEQSTSERERSLLDDHLMHSNSALLRLLQKDWKAAPPRSHSTGARTLSLNKELIACAAWSEMHSLPADDTTPQSTTSSAAQKEETPAAKEAFRQYFMRAMTATFGDELDQLREQEQLSEAPEKLELLVDCLGLGMRAYTQEERALCLRQE
ncbi:Ribosome assembly protein 3 [Balamuthia mandrillaris]